MFVIGPSVTVFPAHCHCFVLYMLCSLCYRTAKLKHGLLKPPGSTPHTPTPCPIPALPSTRWPSPPANGATPCKCCSLQCGRRPMTALHPPGSPPASRSHNNNSNSNSSSRFPSTRSWAKASKPSRSNPSIDPHTYTSTELDPCWERSPFPPLRCEPIKGHVGQRKDAIL